MRSRRQVESFMVCCVGRDTALLASGVDFACLELIFMRMAFTWERVGADTQCSGSYGIHMERVHRS